jgi:hypothetical protein
VWIAGLAVIAAIAATYQLTRPPDLVWWTSPPIGKSGLRAKALIPQGWHEESSSEMKGSYQTHYFTPPELNLRWLRWIVSKWTATGSVMVTAGDSGPEWLGGPQRPGETHLQPDIYVGRSASRRIISGNSKEVAAIEYISTDRPAFEHNYRTICNSLRIE